MVQHTVKSDFTGGGTCVLLSVSSCWLDVQKSETDPVQQQHPALIHVEMGFDAFGLCVCILLEAVAYSRQLDRGQVQRAKHAAKHQQNIQTLKASYIGASFNASVRFHRALKPQPTNLRSS